MSSDTEDMSDNKKDIIILEPKKSDRPGALAGILETFKVSEYRILILNQFFFVLSLDQKR